MDPLNPVSYDTGSDTHPAVFVVEDDATERKLLAMLLQAENLAVHAFQDAQTFLNACQPEIRGCAIIDEKMPGMSGLSLQLEMAQRGYSLPVIFLSGYGDVQTVVKAIKAGAVNFLPKPVNKHALLASVHAAMAQDVSIVSDINARREMVSRLGLLTVREQEILLLAIRGHTSKEIAQHLAISHRTVEIHRANILHKTGASNLLELARLTGLHGG